VIIGELESLATRPDELPAVIDRIIADLPDSAT
jgi:hypothetical protein